MLGEFEARKGAVLKVLLPRTGELNAAARSNNKSSTSKRQLRVRPATPPYSSPSASSLFCSCHQLLFILNSGVTWSPLPLNVLQSIRIRLLLDHPPLPRHTPTSNALTQGLGQIHLRL